MEGMKVERSRRRPMQKWWNFEEDRQLKAKGKPIFLIQKMAGDNDDETHICYPAKFL